MRLVKLMTSLAAGVCVLAACSARAQVTNHVTFSAVSVNQGAINDNGTNTTFAAPKVQGANNAKLLQEIGAALNVSFTAPKLVLITGNGGAGFAVIDGANFYDLSSAGFNIMNISDPLNIQVKSGKQSDVGVQEKTTQKIPITIVYDDTSSGTGNQLAFTLSGIVTVTETRTTPAVGTGIYTDTESGKISGLTGGGTSKGNPFTATGSIEFSGSAKLVAF